ncbi:S9 family peptidase [Pseudoblastomonas halimionae]|uniref:Prolyl oligopeptidase family serine peptidase n=1 Tax=Alteriqipengyuania halimionae TaxID=1926630 RepID=A0A6I4U1H6_9SPHN|nr:S9 family peptidase [Alteriqipengyuania halimionae]MXP09748.1 prolyl oligopeptidase family serine peptidase [Alteriqipengyuania halimionae]
MRYLLAALMLSASAIPASAQEVAMTDTAEAPELTFERVFASPSLDGAAPRGVKLSPDGRYLTLLRNREDDRDRYDLWAFDREAADWTMLVDSETVGSGRELSEDEKMQRERARVGNLKGIITYQWAPDGEGLLVPLDGDLYLARLDGTVARLTDTEESELNPTLSKKGTYVSFVRDRQLWVGRVGEKAKPVTPKEGDTIRWGEAEFVAQEEMGRLTGFWWSPNERRIAVQRTDEAPVGIVTRAAIGATGTKTFEQRYPVAGSDNADVRLFIQDPDGANRVEVDLGDEKDIYIPRVDWSPDGGSLFVQRQNRLQNVLELLSVDPVSGESEVILTEKAQDGYWVNLSDNYRFLKDGTMLWWSESDGWAHLYLRTREGPVQLTKGEWEVKDLVGVDEDARRIWFTGTKDDPLETHVYTMSIDDPSSIRRVTELGYTNGASMDAKGQTLLISRSNDTQPTQSYIADGDGNRLAWIEENRVDADHPYAPYLASHRPAQYGSIEASDGSDLYYEMVTPELEPGKRYPVFFYHYGGPTSQVVDKGWGGALRQAVVDKGYIWFALDNRGTPGRGVDFLKQIYRAMGTIEVEDQATGAKWLKTLDFVDPDKIATYGWSYGGYMSILMLERYPGLYAAGIAGAPVTKWELYDTHYTERFLGTPQDDAEAYATGNAILEADKIVDPLLLVHGMADDNVVFENATELIAALQEANVQFDMMLYPGYTHRVAGENISPHLWNTYFRFLEQNGVTAPE